MATFHFDNSDDAFTDPDARWLNEANAFDGSTLTTATVSANGSTSSNYMFSGGTNVPNELGGKINSVRARMNIQFIASSNTAILNAAIYTDGLAELLGTVTANAANFSSYITLTEPTGGWTIAKLQALEVKFYKTNDIDDSVGVRKLELDIAIDPIARGIYRKQGYQ